MMGIIVESEKVAIPMMKMSREGLHLLNQLPRSEHIREYFQNSSFISRVLMRDPGTFKMLEVIYTGEGVQGAIDEYFFRSLAGQALRNRLSSIVSCVGKMIAMEVEERGNIKVANLGSGSGRDTIEILAGNSHLTDSVSVDCVDIDSDALEKGKELVSERGLTKNFNFIKANLMILRYRKEIDFGLLVGILCGLNFRTCVAVLRKIRPYFKKGGLIIASNVLKTMPEEDPFTAYLLREVIGWRLIYKTSGELRQIFEKAGYRWQGVFYDEPTRFHAMGIGMVPFT